MFASIGSFFVGSLVGGLSSSIVARFAFDGKIKNKILETLSNLLLGKVVGAVPSVLCRADSFAQKRNTTEVFGFGLISKNKREFSQNIREGNFPFKGIGMDQNKETVRLPVMKYNRNKI